MKAILLLTVLGVIAMFSEIFKFKRFLYPIVLIGMAGAIGLTVSYWSYDDGKQWNDMFQGMIYFDSFDVVMATIILFTGLLWFIFANSYFKEESSLTDHFALVLFALVGALILCSYRHMVMLFLGIEILSIPLYVMAGSRKTDLASNESALKYFLMGSFASGFLLFGIALIYGATGTFSLPAMHEFFLLKSEGLPMFFYAGLVMLLVGLLFKVSAAPFHFWAADVYQGAPTTVTAFMSTIVKTAAFAAFIRLFSPKIFGFDNFHSMSMFLSVCVMLTLAIGNLTAAVQTSVKRMLAYSSISHAGFLLMAVIANNAVSIEYYAAAYSIASIAAFTVLLAVVNYTGGDSVDHFNGLGKRSPLLAITMAVALLSLAGIPPTAGFFAKYYVFNAMISAGHPWLVVFAVVMSLVGVYYYFRILIAMFFRESTVEEKSPKVSEPHQALLFFAALAIIALGLMPDLILNLKLKMMPVVTTMLPH